MVISSARVLAFVVAAGCISTQGPVEPLPPGGVHILFVGNSLTAANDLPGTVAALGTSIGDTIRVASAVGPDLALIDHLNGATDALSQLQHGGWQFVVLQQGPSSLAANQDSLLLWTKMFDPHIRAAGAKPALLMVWPSSDRAAFFDDVRRAYENAATGVNGVFIPAGVGWLNAWAHDSTLRLYGADGYHPSALGTFVAALVVYERVTGHDARRLPPHAGVAGAPLDIPEATVRALQAAAHQANAQYPDQ